MVSMKKKAKQTPPPAPPSPIAESSGGDDVDRISALDDDLCELILRLAHLKVRELVRTSVLSRRWRGLWKRFPVLDFLGWPDFRSVGAARRYIAIVNDVLEQRAGAISEARIDELRIRLWLDADRIPRKQRPLLWTSDLKAPAKKAAEAWIRYAMHHQVKAFQFNLLLLVAVAFVEQPVMDLDELLPSSPKLESLHLGLVHTEVRLPRIAVFASLKDLTLESVELAAGSCHLLARLLELSMECVYEMELLELRTRKLLYLKMDECERMESLRILAPGLKELTYFSNTFFVQGHLPCVQHLKIDLVAYTYLTVDVNRSTIDLLKLCSSSIRCLLVRLYVLPEEDRYIELIKDNIPQLPNITSLMVSIDVSGERHSFGDGVASLLRGFKNLECLSLVLEDTPNIEDEYYSEDAEAFSCNHPDHWNTSDIYLAKLRKADFRGMTGTGCEICFLQFVLASATDLRSVTVSFNLCFIKEEVQDSRMHNFLHSLLGDGTWTTCDKPYKRSKLYKWAPSP